MNIKEHIDARHYPVDDKGRALVPLVRNAGVLVVLCTDRPGLASIVGWVQDSHLIGCYVPDSEHLLPPPPRKAKVIARIESTVDGFVIRHLAKADGGGFRHGEVIELAGEYEEPWS